MTDAAVHLSEVSVRFDRTVALERVDWRVGAGERWVVLGPNGSGKTTLLRLAGAWLRPSSGTVDVLGERLGRTDMRALRARVGFSSQSLVDQLRSGLTPHDVVLMARFAALETYWHSYSDEDHGDADDRLARFGIGPDKARRALSTLSAGERQRVLLARAFAGDPDLVILDEPTAGLDVGSREELVHRLDDVASTSRSAIVLVTHHLEEIPPSWTHALALRAGASTASGAIQDVIDAETMSAVYGIDLDVQRRHGRWSAIAL